MTHLFPSACMPPLLGLSPSPLPPAQLLRSMLLPLLQPPYLQRSWWRSRRRWCSRKRMSFWRWRGHMRRKWQHWRRATRVRWQQWWSLSRVKRDASTLKTIGVSQCRPPTRSQHMWESESTRYRAMHETTRCQKWLAAHSHRGAQ